MITTKYNTPTLLNQSMDLHQTSEYYPTSYSLLLWDQFLQKGLLTTTTHRAPLSMELSRQEYWSG